VLHKFDCANDGCLPLAGLLEEAGIMYGTTWQGGAYDAGTVFELIK
jgi:hypothetical protein